MEDAVHLEEEFSHNGGEGDLGGFTGQAKSGVKLSEGSFLHPSQSDGAHVESASRRSTATADVTLSFPWAALPDPGGQSGQCCGLLPVKRAQFGHVAQDIQGGDRADAIQLFELMNLRLDVGHTSQCLLAFFFDLGHLLFQVGDEFLLLARDVGGDTVLDGLTGTCQLVFKLIAPLHKSPQFIPRGLTGRRGFGTQRHAVGGEDARVNRIVFGALSLRQGKVSHPGRVEHTDGLGHSVQRGHDAFFVAARGFADDLHAGNSSNLFQEKGVSFRVVVQNVVNILEVS